MHGRMHHNSLPTLKRGSSPQPATLPFDARTASTKKTSSPAPSSVDVAAPSMPFGQPWATPATLNSLSTSLTRQQHEQELQRAGASVEASPSRRLRAALPTTTTTTTINPLLCGSPVAALLGNSRDGKGQQHAHAAVKVHECAAAVSFDGATRAPDVSSLPPPTTTSNGAAAATLRAERLRDLETYVLQRAGRQATMADRQKAVQRSLSLLPSLYPKLAGILDSVQRYTVDIAAQVQRMEEDKAEALRQQEQKLYAEFEAFFEGKIKELVVARQKAEARAEAEHAAAFAVRQERDTELVKAKEELLQRLNECEHTEEQFRDFRHLIASVFQTNQQLTLRIDQLESVLTRHRIDIPPANDELSAYKTSSEANVGSGRGGGGGDSNDSEMRALSTQVPVEFMAAANKELVKSRLTLQQELLHSAFDDHSAYRLRIEGLTRQNQDLTFRITELEEKVKELYTYIHQKRFITRVDEYGHETTPLTPRPREVPLALQTELGIELRHSTANILTELSIVALNMKHQLNSALLRTRQLHALSTWLNGADATGEATTATCVVGAMLQQVTEAAVIPVFPVSAWPAIPHFLRTNVSSEVRNYVWTEAQAGCLFYNFFASYKAVRARARFVRDGKMLAPRVYQLFEHRRVLLTRLDVNKEDAAQSEENIPFGYVVSQFAREVLTHLSPQNTQDALPLVLPGTITTRYPLNPPGKVALDAQKAATVSDLRAASLNASLVAKKVTDGKRVEECEWVEAAPVVELDWTRFTYNMWYAALRYQATQPLCQLFVELVDGRLPLETFDVTERVLARVQRLVNQLDNERSRRFSYPRLANGVVRWLNDTGAQAVLRGVQTVVQAFEDNHTPIHGGTLDSLALFADETYCDREKVAASLSAETAARQQCTSFVPVNDTAAAKAAAAREKPRTPLPGSLIVRQLPLPSIGATASPTLALPPLGATVFVRYWRSFVHDVLSGMYTRIEAVLAPLVEESEVVLGLYLLSVPRAMAALAQLDDIERQAALRSAVFGGGGIIGGAVAFGLAGQNPEDTVTGAKLVAEAADLLGVHSVARSFLTLLEARKGVLQEKKMTEKQVATETVTRAVAQLPHFKFSTHFPFRLQQQEAAAAALRAEEAGAEAAEGELITANSAKSTITPSSFAITNEAAFAKELKNGGGKNSKKVGRSTRKLTKKTQKAGVESSTDAKGDPLPSGTDQSDSHLFGRRQRKSEQHIIHQPPNSSDALRNPASQDLPPKTANIITNAENLAFAGDLMSTSVEGDLIEWYSLRHTLRQIMPDFPFLVFQPDAYERAEEAETLSKLPALKAFEESPPTLVSEGDS